MNKTLLRAAIAVLAASALTGRAEAKLYGYTANEGANTVSVIDTETNTEVKKNHGRIPAVAVGCQH